MTVTTMLENISNSKHVAFEIMWTVNTVFLSAALSTALDWKIFLMVACFEHLCSGLSNVKVVVNKPRNSMA